MDRKHLPLFCVPLPFHRAICRLGESLWTCYSDTALYLLFSCRALSFARAVNSIQNPVSWTCCVKDWPFCVQKEQRLQHREGFWLSSADELCWHQCSPIKCHQIKPWSRVRCKARCFRQECQLPFVFWNEDSKQSQSCTLTRVTWVDLVRFWKAVSMYEDLKKKNS